MIVRITGLQDQARLEVIDLLTLASDYHIRIDGDDAVIIEADGETGDVGREATTVAGIEEVKIASRVVELRAGVDLILPRDCAALLDIAAKIYRRNSQRHPVIILASPPGTAPRAPTLDVPGESVVVDLTDGLRWRDIAHQREWQLVDWAEVDISHPPRPMEPGAHFAVVSSHDAPPPDIGDPRLIQWIRALAEHAFVCVDTVQTPHGLAGFAERTGAVMLLDATGTAGAGWCGRSRVVAAARQWIDVVVSRVRDTRVEGVWVVAPRRWVPRGGERERSECSRDECGGEAMAVTWCRSVDRAVDDVVARWHSRVGAESEDSWRISGSEGGRDV